VTPSADRVFDGHNASWQRYPVDPVGRPEQVAGWRSVLDRVRRRGVVAVRGYRLTGLEQYNIARHQVAHRHLGPLAVAQSKVRTRHHRLQRLRGPLRGVLRAKPTAALTAPRNATVNVARRGADVRRMRVGPWSDPCWPAGRLA
jgi:hypothetical protein